MTHEALTFDGEIDHRAGVFPACACGWVDWDNGMPYTERPNSWANAAREAKVLADEHVDDSPTVEDHWDRGDRIQSWAQDDRVSP